MRVFKEIQAFRQWWILLILAITVIGISIKIYFEIRNSNFEIWDIGSFILLIAFYGLFWNLKLHTKIDAKGVSARFEPFPFFRKNYKWNEISKCHVRKYSALTEYGGWGIRGLGSAKAYNVSGNMGIQIITKNQEKFLIGTKKPEDAKKAIKRYQEKIQQI